MKSPDVEIAIDIYYRFTEIGNAEIMRLFDCKKGTAQKLKTKAREKMAIEGKRTFVKGAVDTVTAYEAWGINIEVYKERFIQLNKTLKGRKAT